MSVIDATHVPQSGVLVSAYRDIADGVLVIVVINQNTTNVSQSFGVNGTTLPTMTPSITSASFNLTSDQDVASTVDRSRIPCRRRASLASLGR